MFKKHDVRFSVEGGIELSAWLFVPEGHRQPLPAITMAHGYAGTKYHGIEPIAEAFAEAGFVVLVRDDRGFGDSGGEPRHDINPWQQITDWRRALSYLQDRPEVDEDGVGLWGTSFAGGHALVLGATDRRLKAIVSQVPTIDGHAAGLRRVPPENVAHLEALFAADDRAQLRGEPLATQVSQHRDGAELVPGGNRCRGLLSEKGASRTLGEQGDPFARPAGPGCMLRATGWTGCRRRRF